MASDDEDDSSYGDSLEFKVRIALPEMVIHCQIDDGTIFYFDPDTFGGHSAQRIYVLWEREEIDADLSLIKIGNGLIANMCAVGDAIYIESNRRKVFKAVFSPSEGIQISYLRDKPEGESWGSSGMCYRKVDGKTYAFRQSDDPETDGILVDKIIEELGQHWFRSLVCIHRGKAVIFKHKPDFYPRILKSTDTIIEIDFPEASFKTYANDSSSFIYIYIKTRLYPALCIIDTDTMEFMPILPIANLPSIHEIMRVRNAEISVKSSKGTMVAALYTARLPDGYFTEMPEERSDNAFDSKFLSEFSCEGIVGVGQFGSVFKATKLLDECTYAVKRIAMNSSLELNAKTQEEIRTMAKLAHPGIVRYHNAWIEEPPEAWEYPTIETVEDSDQNFQAPEKKTIYIFIQMELCNESLEDWLNRNRETRNRDQMRSWFKQLVLALEYIHSAGIIHRDLKPRNILVVSDNIVKICDLGIATCYSGDANNSLTMRTANMGTPLYMAPEQNFIYDKRVDIFAFGLILLELFVIMTGDEKLVTFSNIRCGIPLKVLHDQPSTLDLITQLTKLDRDQRPSLKEVLEHSFFTE